MKPDELEFCRWENDCFGFGYGTGEEPILIILKTFFDSLDDEKYDYKNLEEIFGSGITWLLINALCKPPSDRRLRKDSVIDYGTSPRFGWLTDEGKRLRDFCKTKSVEELCKILDDYDAMDDDEVYQVEAL